MKCSRYGDHNDDVDYGLHLLSSTRTSTSLFKISSANFDRVQVLVR
jgi:hypothetical protein